MKKLLTLLTMALMAICANAQAVFAEVDWTQKSEWDLGWYSYDYATVSVEQGTGLIIESNPPAGAYYWEPMIPMIGHIPVIEEGGQYFVHFEFVSPCAGELRLDFYSWDGSGATMAQVIEVAEGDNDFTLEFLDYPTPCTDAGIFYECGKLPGKHIIKSVQVYMKAPTTPYNQADICYNFIAKGKVAEVIYNPKKQYRGVVEIPTSVMHDGEEYTVSKIADNAFAYCERMASVTIPNSVTTIGYSAFSGCSGLTSLTIPSNVTSIGSSTFSGCSGLTSLSIPSSVTSIGSSAFSGCSSLASLTIPSSVTSIGNNAFDGCKALRSIDFLPNTISTISDGMFSGCSGLTSVTIPYNVTSIGDYAFSGCSSLTSLSIPNSVTSIGSSAFSSCSSLTSLNIPSSVTTISNYVFFGCSGLSSITIPNSVTSIGSSAFSNCSKLSSITIGEGVRWIYSNAFANCQQLTDVYCLAENVPNTNSDAFSDSYIDYTTLHVPSASLNNYKNAEPWKNFKSKVALSGGDIPETPKCAKPTITYNNGVITFSCETEGAEFISEVKANDNKREYNNKIILSNTYTVSVYATKTGYDNSETVTMEVIGTGGILGDLTGDGKVDVADHVKLSNIIMNK